MSATSLSSLLIGPPTSILHKNLCEFTHADCPVDELQEALAREEILLREKDELLQRHELLARESDHRLLNNLQMVASLLSVQGRAATTPESARQFAAAANRVATIGRIHRHLHSADGAEKVAFKPYLEELCRDSSALLSSHESPKIAVRAIELELPSDTGIPLGFVVNELITNAAKHGKGRISVQLERRPNRHYALSVSNDGPSLPENFDPSAGKGVGMRIVRSLVERIGGELQVDKGDDGQGARFVVLFR